MSLNRHVLTIGALELHSLAAGRSVRIRSDKDMLVDAYPTDEPAPAAQSGVAQCPVTPDMIEDLRREGRTGIAPTDNPYMFGLHLQA